MTQQSSKPELRARTNRVASNRRAASTGQAASQAVVAVALIGMIALGAFMMWRHDPYSLDESGLGERFNYRVGDANAGTDDIADASLPYAYRLERSWDVACTSARAIATDDAGTVYVAIDRAIIAYDRDGTPRRRIALANEPHAIAVGGEESAWPGQIILAMADDATPASDDDGASEQPAGDRIPDKLVVLAEEGDVALRVPPPNNDAWYTSVAAMSDSLYAADYGNRIVWRFAEDGSVVNEIGRADNERGIFGFIVPSPHFDLAAGADGLLRVVNPGGHCVDAFTPEGDRETSWGKPGLEIDRFCGCCNPAAMAMSGDGRFLTAEKGLRRVNVYDHDGKLVGVVARPKTFDPTASAIVETRDEHRLKPLDVATLGDDGVVVLDPSAKRVFVFCLVDGDKKVDDRPHQRIP